MMRNQPFKMLAAAALPALLFLSACKLAIRAFLE